jgi:hypothetical protein
MARQASSRRRLALRQFGKAAQQVPHTVAPAQPAGLASIGSPPANAAAFDPDWLPVAVNPVKQVKFSVLKAFAGSGAAQAEDVPADEAAVGGQRTRVSMRARAPSKTMVSCGSHSSVAPFGHREIDALRSLRSRRCDTTCRRPASSAGHAHRRQPSADRQMVAAGNARTAGAGQWSGKPRRLPDTAPSARATARDAGFRAARFVRRHGRSRGATRRARSKQCSGSETGRREVIGGLSGKGQGGAKYAGIRSQRKRSRFQSAMRYALEIILCG